MKILVLSDSHGSLRFMRRAITAVKPDAVVHLGDYYEDGETLEQEFHWIPFHIVPGNCDLYRRGGLKPAVLCYTVCGVRLFMTHGHNHAVKMTLYRLMESARENHAQAVLFGHTHTACCERESDGLWVLNPGACGSGYGSVGLVETENGTITACWILRQAELEELA